LPTDKQTDKQRKLHILVGGGKNVSPILAILGV